MELPTDRRVLIGAGIAAVLVVVLILVLISGGKSETPESAVQNSLIVDVGREDTKIDPNRQLPCYVNGQSIGMATHAKCAERNGVTSGQLDVGIDQSGELAYGAAGASLAPLPPEDAKSDAVGALTTPSPAVMPAQTVPAATPQASRGPVAACWRYAGRDWSRIGEMPLEACAQTLFDGRCEKPGGATYGRWGEQTLRLVPGQIEQSPDNFNFHTLVRQGANCTVPGF